MHRNVEILIGRLTTDPELATRFEEHPDRVLSEQGLELSEIEKWALVAIDPVALRTFAGTLDSRLRKASAAATSRTGGGTAQPAFETREEKTR